MLMVIRYIYIVWNCWRVTLKLSEYQQKFDQLLSSFILRCYNQMFQVMLIFCQFCAAETLLVYMFLNGSLRHFLESVQYIWAQPNPQTFFPIYFGRWTRVIQLMEYNCLHNLSLRDVNWNQNNIIHLILSKMTVFSFFSNIVTNENFFNIKQWIRLLCD